MGPSFKLPPNQTVLDVADAARSAVDRFLEIDPHDKLALTRWLMGPYRHALAHVPKHTRTLGHGEIDPSELSTVVMNAQVLLEEAIEAAGKPGAEPLLSLLPPTGIDVVPVVDADGTHGFAPMDVTHSKLAARVLTLLVADYLTRPADYFAAAAMGVTRRASSPRMRAAG